MEIKRVWRRTLRAMRRTLLRQEDPRFKLLEKMGRGSRCAEIGVWKGDFSRDILRLTAPRELHLIDPWAFLPEFPERKFGGRYAEGQADMDRVFERVKDRFAGFSNVFLHRTTSAEALASFPDGFFDWVYVDGNHDFDYVREDLNLSFQKVRPGGSITGDDYSWGRKRGFPVKNAVAEFLKARDLEDRIELVGNQYIIERV